MQDLLRELVYSGDAVDASGDNATSSAPSPATPSHSPAATGDTATRKPATSSRKVPGSTQRNRERRRRLAEGLTLSAPLEIREDELDLLVAHEMLKVDERRDRQAIAAALYALMESAFPALERGDL
jgi:hypothetical protein